MKKYTLTMSAGREHRVESDQTLGALLDDIGNVGFILVTVRLKDGQDDGFYHRTQRAINASMIAFITEGWS